MRVRAWAIAGWTLPLGALAWVGIPALAARLEPPSASQEVPPTAGVTDISSYNARASVARYAQVMEELPDDGSPGFRDCGDGDRQMVRIFFTEAWGRGSFLLTVSPQQATWHSVRFEQPGRFVAHHVRTVPIDPGAWDRVLSSVSPPAFRSLPVGVAQLTDHDAWYFETCLRGQWRLVNVDSLGDPVFRDAVHAVAHAAGDAMPIRDRPLGWPSPPPVEAESDD